MIYLSVLSYSESVKLFLTELVNRASHSVINEYSSIFSENHSHLNVLSYFSSILTGKREILL